MAAPFQDEDGLVLDDYYALLNVDRKASKDEINASFRRLSKIYHPDKHVDPSNKKDAENMFAKLKRAHEVLLDPHKRTIYDTYGEKGLETEGLEVVSKVKTPAEIIAEYERLQREKEERRLQQRTNPRGSVSVGIDVSDVFEPYLEDDEIAEYRSATPSVEVNNMSIFQSVECPLTTKDTAIIAGTLSTQNGNGQGTFLATWRRLTSNKGWAEVELAAGNGLATSVKGFRQISKRCYGIMGCTLASTERGIVASYSATLAYQLDKNLQVKVTWNAGYPSSMTTVLVYDSQKHRALASIQLGVPHCHGLVSYTRKLHEHEAKVRCALKISTAGFTGECGIEKKITQFSVLGATLSVGVPSGVNLRIKLHRGSQSFIFPIHLSDSICPPAIVYGTVVPIVAYYAAKVLVIDPFLKNQKIQELQKTKEENAEKLKKKKQEAEAAVELMKETVDRSIDYEERKSGLIIVKALYGKLLSESDSQLHGEFDERQCISVTVPLQSIVKESKLILPDQTTKSGLPGFYDPCIGEEKSLYIQYRFRNKIHEITLADKDPIRLPQQKHLQKEQTDVNGSGVR